MARLVRLKVSMTVAILLITIVFSAFLLGLLILFQLPLLISIPLTLLLVMIYILFQYMIGPAMVRWSTRLRYLKAGEHPWLETTVKELAEKSAMPPPKLAIVPDQTPNAFVFGRTAGGATLAVHEGLLKQLNQEEIRGVIGHELGHIKHKDFVVMTVLSALPLIAYLIAQLTFRAALYTDGGDKKEGARGTPRQLESALTKITYGLSLSPKPPHGARTLYIGDPALAKQECQGILRRKEEYDLDKDGVLDEKELELAMEREAKSRWTTINTWFTTHPATYQRVLLLREIDKEMVSGQYTSERVYMHI